MGGLSGRIEDFLLELMQDCADGRIEIGRNDLAEKFDCAPSQINYVLSTRFTPYNGYYIESRRGGSGYIRIVRLSYESGGLIKKIINDPGLDSLTSDRCQNLLKGLYDQELISEKEYRLMKMATDESALKDLSLEMRKTVRASILKNMLLVLLD